MRDRIRPPKELEDVLDQLKKDEIFDTKQKAMMFAAALGYASQTAFAAAFRKLTGETPSDWRKRTR